MSYLKSIQEGFRSEVARTGSFYDCVGDVRALSPEDRGRVLAATSMYAVIEDGVVTGELVDGNWPTTYNRGFWVVVDLCYAEAVTEKDYDDQLLMNDSRYDLAMGDF